MLEWLAQHSRLHRRTTCVIEHRQFFAHPFRVCKFDAFSGIVAALVSTIPNLNSYSWNQPSGVRADPSNTFVYVSVRLSLFLFSHVLILTLALFILSQDTYNRVGALMPCHRILFTPLAHFLVHQSLRCLCTVRRVEMATGNMIIVAGQVLVLGSQDGVGSNALFGTPRGGVLDPGGLSLFLTDSNYNTIRRITLATFQVVTIAGTSNPTNSFADGIGTLASFGSPYSLAIDSTGANLFIADQVSLCIFFSIEITALIVAFALSQITEFGAW